MKKKYLNNEKRFSVTAFRKNWHNTTALEKFSNEYLNKIKKENIEIVKHDKIVNIAWVPIPRPKLRQELRQKLDVRTIFNSGRNLKNLICKNKSKLLLNRFGAVYQLGCTCNALYIGESKTKCYD